MNISSITASELLAILDVARHLAEQRMVQPLVEYVVVKVFELIPAELCLIAFFADSKLEMQLARTRDGRLLDNATDQVSHSILTEVRTSLTPLLVDDALSDDDFKSANSVRSLGLRSVMCVPLVAHERAIGAIYVENRTAGRWFRDENLFPLVLLANQVVVAIENARMYESLESRIAERTSELSQAITHLRSTQSQLVQSEKMAALGSLVAGVAHELRNPLNFVNNLARLSIDLVAELEDLLTQSAQPSGQSGDLGELLDYLRRNCQEIFSNGQRADGIISMMLLHTRSDGGHRELVDLNALIRQSLNLAYHSLRARKPDAKPVRIDEQLQPDLPPIEAVPQQLSQAFINLFDNACYALWQQQHAMADFRPVLRVTTAIVDSQIEIRIWDNGVGIPPAIQSKLFEPFMTTKPPGEGTGLGLSLTYDIIVSGHAGSVRVVSEAGRSTEFVIDLPINSATAAGQSSAA